MFLLACESRWRLITTLRRRNNFRKCVSSRPLSRKVKGYNSESPDWMPQNQHVIALPISGTYKKSPSPGSRYSLPVYRSLVVGLVPRVPGGQRLPADHDLAGLRGLVVRRGGAARVEGQPSAQEVQLLFRPRRFLALHGQAPIRR